MSIVRVGFDTWGRNVSLTLCNFFSAHIVTCLLSSAAEYPSNILRSQTNLYTNLLPWTCEHKYKYRFITMLHGSHITITDISSKQLDFVKKHYVAFFISGKNFTAANMSHENFIWAATWQNQHNECVPSKDSDQPWHPLSSCGQRRLWSDWVDVQIRVFAGRTVILLVLSCCGSFCV